MFSLIVNSKAQPLSYPRSIIQKIGFKKNKAAGLYTTFSSVQHLPIELDQRFAHPPQALDHHVNAPSACPNLLILSYLSPLSHFQYLAPFFHTNHLTFSFPDIKLFEPFLTYFILLCRFIFKVDRLY